MLTVFSAEICPFAQRTRALLTHLDVPFEVREVDLDDRDPELLERSPTGSVPFLVEGEFTLWESRVINEYLADRFEWEEAWADDTELRGRQRLAMDRWDRAILPAAFYQAMGEGGGLGDEERATVEAELDGMTRTVRQLAGDAENLLGIHCGPFWARMVWLREHAPSVIELVEHRPELKAWLDASVELEAIRETLPEREWAVRQYEEAYVKKEPARA